MTAQKEIVAAIARVEAALSAAARSRHIPDYHGFQEKIGGQLLKERTARAGALHPDPGPTTIAAISLLSKYHQRMNDGSFSPINFRRFKLLYSLFNGSARGSQMVSALLQDSLPSDPTLDADDITPAQLRMRLIIAVEKGAYDDASFLVGLLDEVDHDPGERAFLRALVAYASGKLERTIALVGGIPLDAIDRPKSAWMAAKAAALLGDRASLDRLLDEIGDRISTFGWLHLIELLGRSLDGEDYPGFRDRIPQRLVGSPQDPAYEEWATLHVQTMRPFLARLREFSAASEATGEALSDDVVQSDAALNQADAALAVEHILGRKTGAKELVELLEPLIAKGSLAAFRICVETLLDAGEFGILVRYAQRFPYNPSLPWHRELDIVGALYTAAVLRDDGLERRLKRLLPSDRAEPSVGAARRLDIARRLTSMGRLSFLSAATELDHVRAVDDLWRDCGLISLGLFRALELEFNSRLVRPLAGRLDITTLRSQLPPRIALGSTLKELGKVLQSGHGLMLGSLRTLLMQFVPESADDLATLGVRQQVRSEFDRLLSSVTDKDRALLELSNMISETVVRSYRNPPAHGQFLRIGEAVAALKHVEDALDSVTTFLPIAQ